MQQQSSDFADTVSGLVAALLSLLVTAVVASFSIPESAIADIKRVQHESPLDTANRKEKTGTLPSRLSELNGWHGVRLRKTSELGRVYCSCEIPDRLGKSNGDEIVLLFRLIRNDLVLKNDFGCEFVGCRGAALEQAFYIATKYQHADAGRWFVAPKGLVSLNLERSGELGELYDTNYRPAVLIQFENLKQIIQAEEEKSLASEICDVAVPSADAYLDGKGIAPVIESLKQKKMHTLAREISEQCGVDE